MMQRCPMRWWRRHDAQRRLASSTTVPAPPLAGEAISADDRDISIERRILRVATKADMLVLPAWAHLAPLQARCGARKAISARPRRWAAVSLVSVSDAVAIRSERRGTGKRHWLHPGTVTRLRTSKVPHMGWNNIEWRETAKRTWKDRAQTAYFANAYICQPEAESPPLPGRRIRTRSSPR